VGAPFPGAATNGEGHTDARPAAAYREAAVRSAERGPASSFVLESGMPHAVPQLVRTADNFELALKTIVVSTRAAISTHRKAGNDVLIHASARQGLGLLDDLESQLPGDAPEDDRMHIEEARRVLASLAEGG
jgi:hypothetical protein